MGNGRNVLKADPASSSISWRVFGLEHANWFLTMDNLSPPAYGRDDAPAYYSSHGAGQPETRFAQRVLALDPTGLFIKDLSAKDTPPLYVLNASLLDVKMGSSIHIKRPHSTVGDNSYVPIYAIGDHFMSPLQTRKKLFQDILVARSHGLFVWARLREVVWDFSTRVPLKKGDGMDGLKAGGSVGPTDPVYLIGVGNGPGTVRKNLLQLYRGRWISFETVDEGETVGLEREGGAECEGMPVLSLTKDLDPETRDFLIAAWCVTLWGEVGKRARRLSKSSGQWW